MCILYINLQALTREWAVFTITIDICDVHLDYTNIGMDTHHTLYVKYYHAGYYDSRKTNWNKVLCLMYLISIGYCHFKQNTQFT